MLPSVDLNFLTAAVVCGVGFVFVAIAAAISCCCYLLLLLSAPAVAAAAAAAAAGADVASRVRRVAMDIRNHLLELERLLSKQHDAIAVYVHLQQQQQMFVLR